MARIRSIKPEFWSNEQVMSCTPLSRLLFIGLWNFCDDSGVHPLKPISIKALVFPGDDIDSTSIRRALYELSSNDLIVLYEAGGKEYLQVTGWTHQRIDKPTKKYPVLSDGIPLNSTTCSKNISEPSRSPLGALSEPSATELELELEKDQKKDQKLLSSGKPNDEKADPKKPPFETIRKIYNDQCGHILSKAVKLDPKRKRNIEKCWAEKHNGVRLFASGAFWKLYFDKCLTSSHWKGEDGPWRADLEFLTRDTTVTKVFEMIGAEELDAIAEQMKTAAMKKSEVAA